MRSNSWPESWLGEAVGVPCVGGDAHAGGTDGRSRMSSNQQPIIVMFRIEEKVPRMTRILSGLTSHSRCVNVK